MYALSMNVAAAIMAADTMYGRMSLRKLMPVDIIAIISLLPASFDVKKITAMNVNSGENWLAK